MALKRGSDALVAMPDMKRSRNELVAATIRDKALLEAVSTMFIGSIGATQIKKSVFFRRV